MNKSSVPGEGSGVISTSLTLYQDRREVHYGRLRIPNISFQVGKIDAYSN